MCITLSTYNALTGYDLLNICINGPKQDLDKTIYSQPAVLVTSLAAIEKLRHEDPLVSQITMYEYND